MMEQDKENYVDSTSSQFGKFVQTQDWQKGTDWTDCGYQPYTVSNYSVCSAPMQAVSFAASELVK